MKSLLLFVFLYLCCTTRASAQQYENFVFNPRKYICHKATGTITVDGLMNEPDWQQQEWTEDFVDIEGPTRPQPLQNTRVKMLWDENYLYVFARLEEKDIWATLTERDTIIFHENDFEVFIDPDGDTHLYYEFEINARNTGWDLLLTKPYRDGGLPITGWDIAGLQSATYIEGTLNDPSDTDQYWNVELAFPLSSLAEAVPGRRRPSDGDQWRINFSRVNWQTEKNGQGYQKKINPETGRAYPEYNWVWTDQGKINMHQPETWGYLQFTNKPAGTKVAF
ncbi:MAG TPA: carbohydrate-binding family 9-like protein, partial [Hanamia sp.]|nr:carbohydrate-binding family 9-like protein [Hanamia sp.]